MVIQTREDPFPVDSIGARWFSGLPGTPVCVIPLCSSAFSVVSISPWALCPHPVCYGLDLECSPNSHALTGVAFGK